MVNDNGEYIGNMKEIIQKDKEKYNISIVNKGSSNIEYLLKKLYTEPFELHLEEVTKIAKRFHIPIMSLESFYMTSMRSNFNFLEKNLSDKAVVILLELLHLMSNGNSADRTRNRIKLNNIQDLCDTIKVSKTTFFKYKKQLEKERLIKILTTKDRIMILFNPVYFRKGSSMSQQTFKEFSEELKLANPLEYIFIYSKFIEEGSDDFLYLKKDSKEISDLRELVKKQLKLDFVEDNKPSIVYRDETL